MAIFLDIKNSIFRYQEFDFQIPRIDFLISRNIIIAIKNEIYFLISRNRILDIKKYLHWN